MNMFYRVLPSFTGFYLVLPGRVGPETGVYRVLPRFFCFKVGKRSKVFYFSLSLSLCDSSFVWRARRIDISFFRVFHFVEGGVG